MDRADRRPAPGRRLNPPRVSPPATVAALLAACRFPPAGSPLTCGVSGGPDSLALLVLGVGAGCDVTAVHVDHGLRDGSADEAEVVRAAAAELGAAFRAERVDVGAGANLEARARAARHGVLGPDCALGHTADDQAETILVNLLRGAGVDGLAGMRPGPRHPILRPASHRHRGGLCGGGPAPRSRCEQPRPGVPAQPGPPRAAPPPGRPLRSRPRPGAGPPGRRPQGDRRPSAGRERRGRRHRCGRAVRGSRRGRPRRAA